MDEQEKKGVQEPLVPEREPDQKNAVEEVEHKTPHEVWVAIGGIVLIVIIAAVLFVPALIDCLNRKNSSDSNNPTSGEVISDDEGGAEQNDYTIVIKKDRETVSLTNKHEKINFDNERLVIELNGTLDEKLSSDDKDFYEYKMTAYYAGTKMNSTIIPAYSEAYGASLELAKVGGHYVIKTNIGEGSCSKDKYAVINQKGTVVESSNPYYFGGDNDSYVSMEINEGNDGYKVEVYSSCEEDATPISVVEYKFDDGKLVRAQ